MGESQVIQVEKLKIVGSASEIKTESEHWHSKLLITGVSEVWVPDESESTCL